MVPQVLYIGSCSCSGSCMTKDVKDDTAFYSLPKCDGPWKGNNTFKIKLFKLLGVIFYPPIPLHRQHLLACCLFEFTFHLSVYFALNIFLSLCTSLPLSLSISVCQIENLFIFRWTNQNSVLFLNPVLSGNAENTTFARFRNETKKWNYLLFASSASASSSALWSPTSRQFQLKARAVSTTFPTSKCFSRRRSKTCRSGQENIVSHSYLPNVSNVCPVIRLYRLVRHPYYVFYDSIVLSITLFILCTYISLYSILYDFIA